MCSSDTECLEMFIVLRICLFLMPNDRGAVILGDIATVVLYNQSGEMFYDLSLGKFGF